MQDNQVKQPENAVEPIMEKSRVLVTKLYDLFPTRLLASLKNKLSQLTLSQWMYLFAFSILLMHIDKDFQKDSALWWVGAIAGVGLVRELWHVFNRVWQHMLGKGLILVLYAATANFALAISALKINVITGIEPGPFVFTLGFATLIMLPFWLLISSIMFFSVALVAGNLWLIVGILLRLVRVKVRVHWEDKVFVFITMIMRLVLIPYVIMSIFFMIVPYAEQIELFEKPIAMLKEESPDNIYIKDKLKAQTEISETIPKDVTLPLNNTPVILPVTVEGDIKWLDKVIAAFIYHFETYPKSACIKLPEQRSLPIDENLILWVIKDESALGYQFSVGHCDGNYSYSNAPQTSKDSTITK